MHHHGYLWTGPKQRFDKEGLRRTPRASDLPPMETAHWLMKSASSIQGTWQEPKEAAAWLGDRLAEYEHRFTSQTDCDGNRLTLLVNSTSERLGWGGDVSFGFYLEHPVFLSMALVTCSPNRTAPELGCPQR
ncbi:hypothetical protein HRW23_13260 [Streptomyces lunaelactis]|uniref:hypothetical protein n=1 Tax=Streptomyces lunaelactis TaxID=1535768 RepID=UPI001584FC1D|nr:hypothetical protein [Streptomyces lunaelactis]NUK23962.1 hypothetical protein [Streptomyces lunaelactis]NUK36190.1 hypothetical protein [Streptomyces lunaelactis]NUK42765.1 hypothetical protein [Streptomyces lunaelactis]NUK52217.1 hypothetical protein [Streptomyces lunaelactis]NUK65842.1 hypothetical protein [Streptomyces lunaelactis]